MSSCGLSLTDFILIIDDCDYIKNCNSNINKNEDSFSYLIKDVVLSQSDCIKLGMGFEKLLSDTILKFTKLINIKPKNKKGYKEKDHLFIDEKNKIIYYAELKGNLNLDTEKSKSTCDKCNYIINELQNDYIDYKIKWCLLGYRYITNKDIKKSIMYKYNDIKDNVYGINEYLNMLNIPFKFTDDIYIEYINKIAIKMFNK